MKTCVRCEIEKSSEDFYRSSSNKDGRHSYCKDCVRDLKREAYRHDPEKGRAASKANYQKHRETRLVANRRRYVEQDGAGKRMQWYWDNHEHSLKKMREQREKHGSKRRQTVRERYHADPEAARAQWREWYANADPELHRARARRKTPRRNNRGSAVALLADPCAYCGGTSEEVDHIVPVATGGDDDWTNLTGSCQSCNRSKQAKPLLLFLLERTTACR